MPPTSGDPLSPHQLDKLRQEIADEFPKRCAQGWSYHDEAEVLELWEGLRRITKGEQWAGGQAGRLVCGRCGSAVCHFDVFGGRLGESWPCIAPGRTVARRSQGDGRSGHLGRTTATPAGPNGNTSRWNLECPRCKAIHTVREDKWLRTFVRVAQNGRTSLVVGQGPKAVDSGQDL